MREEVVEGGDAVDARERDAQGSPDVDQDVVVEVAEQFLRVVEQLDERVLAELVALDGDVEELEALVAAGVGWGLGGQVHSSSLFMAAVSHVKLLHDWCHNLARRAIDPGLPAPRPRSNDAPRSRR